MADARVFDTPVAVAKEEALHKVVALLADVPEAQAAFSERYGNPYLPGSPASLVEAAINDRAVRDEHGQDIMLQALAHVLVHQQAEIEELRGCADRLATFHICRFSELSNRLLIAP